jgi:CheY-like chemotaxis protein
MVEPSDTAGIIYASADDRTRGLLEETLEDMDRVGIPATNGLEAVTLASRTRAELVILDIRMPELDGIRACARIRAMPGYASTPIVVLTFHDTERVQAVAAGAGATMLLARPFGPAKLAMILSKLLASAGVPVAGGPDAPLVAPVGSPGRAQVAGEADSPAATPRDGAMARPERAEMLTAPTILSGVIVADDDPLIRDILKAKLEALGQDVFLTNNGQEAVELASRMTAALVILDIGMPRLDGIAACGRIRALPGHKETPIVMLTFNDTAEAQAEASRVGASMFLAKPFGSAALMLALSRYLPIDEKTLREIQISAIKAAGGRGFHRMRS